jgi:hypothetical protein
MPSASYTDTRDFCRQIYRETIERIDDSELKRALRTHERVPGFIDNLAREFGCLSFSVKREAIERAVRDMTNVFVQCVKRQSEERIMSDMAKLTLKAEAQAREEFRAEAEALDQKTSEVTTYDSTGNETTKQTTEV